MGEEFKWATTQAFRGGYLGVLCFDVSIEIPKSARRAASFPPLVLCWVW